MSKSELSGHYVTVDETWSHYYTLEMKEHSKQWIDPGECASKKKLTSHGKVMATVFGDLHGIVFNHLENENMGTGQYYASYLINPSIWEILVSFCKFSLKYFISFIA